MSAPLDRRMGLGHEIVREAGRIALARFKASDLVVRSKGPNDLVTAADFEIEDLIRRAVGASFAGDAIYGEEQGGAASTQGFTWLIDPIDGTVNFARGIGYFCVSVALLHDGLPVAAWIIDPLSDELFWADPAGRAFLGEAPIRCTAARDLSEAIVGLGFSHRHDDGVAATIVDGLTAASADYRRLGAGALCLAHVAAGRLDAYVEPHMNPWDAVGGLYIAASAGASVLDYSGNGGLEHGAAVFAAASGIAFELLALLPAPFSGAPLHLDNDSRSAGLAATYVATSTRSWKRLR